MPLRRNQNKNLINEDPLEHKVREVCLQGLPEAHGEPIGTFFNTSVDLFHHEAWLRTPGMFLLLPSLDKLWSGRVDSPVHGFIGTSTSSSSRLSDTEISYVCFDTHDGLVS